jgi:hypothetical protein
MRFDAFSFGAIRIDGVTYEYDVVIDRGQVRKRKKKRIQEVPRRLRTHAAIDRGGHTLGMPSASDRDRHRSVAGEG